ncbi:uncharacterized protein LOC110720020 isoform X2 [Chenopodium quinoa]|uniref:uncharacterized protein LOC110720020 isoform X2 n=1 Tax=Chenopodium quinoa TaxID=63459 RepID=UPI000B781550|nr:uncharacterized protein LOC110720020 isoform X2 [Chenopodium quinoa]
MFTKEVAIGMVPPEKTPATSALLLRKKQIEEKKAALAAKNAGAGSQVIPRSLASMHKRPAGNIPQPASKAPKVAALAASGSKKMPDKDRPTTAGKSLQSIPHFEMVVKEIRPAVRTQTGTDSNAAGGALTPQSEKGKTSAFDPTWPLGHMRVKTQASQSGNSSGCCLSIGGAYAQHLTDDSMIADISSNRPNYQQYAKRMVRALIRSEKEVVSAVHTVNLDRITSLLVEVFKPDDLCLSNDLYLPDANVLS